MSSGIHSEWGMFAEANHANLTMGTILPDCNDSQRTLGKGDLKSLAKTYG